MKWGHGGAPSSKKSGALIQKGPLDRHEQREDAVETHGEKALCRWRIGLQDLQALGCPRELGDQQKRETRKDSPPPHVPTNTLDSDLWPLGGQDNKPLLL